MHGYFFNDLQYISKHVATFSIIRKKVESVYGGKTAFNSFTGKAKLFIEKWQGGVMLYDDINFSS